jgi:hypothetical protein
MRTQRFAAALSVSLGILALCMSFFAFTQQTCGQPPPGWQNPCYW